METFYWLGVICVYLGLLLFILEFVVDPWLRGKPLWRLTAVMAVSIGAVVFSVIVVFVSAPLTLDSYVHNSDYLPGTSIAGIPWNSHLTDLRVWVTNPTEKDYGEAFITIRPDQWTHKAAIVTENSGCRLNELGGDVISQSSRHRGAGGEAKLTVHPEGGTYETEDSIGDTFDHFLTHGGYRLTCERFPAHFVIEIIFALAAVKPELLPPNPPDPGNYMVGSKEFGPTDNVFDSILSLKPFSSLVAVDGHYKLGMRTYSISRSVKVKGEN